MNPDKRDELYNNLINSGKVSSAEIGSIDDFKAAISDEGSAREFYGNLLDSGLFTTDEIGSADDFYGSISDDFGSNTQPHGPSYAEQVAGRIMTQPQVGSAPMANVTPYQPASVQMEQSKQEGPLQQQEQVEQQPQEQEQPQKVQQQAQRPKQQGIERFKREMEMQQAISARMQSFNNRMAALRSNDKPFGKQIDALAPAREARIQEEAQREYEDNLNRAMLPLTQSDMAARRAWMNADQKTKEQWKAFRFVGNEAAYQRNHDIDKMAEDAWNNIDEQAKQRAIKNVARVLVEQYGMGRSDAYSNAEKIVRGESDKMMYEEAVRQNAPKGVLDYMVRKINDNNFAPIVEGLARIKSGTIGDMQARDEANQQYRKENWLGGLVGDVTGLASSLGMYAAGGLASGTVKAGTKMAVKQSTKKALKKGIEKETAEMVGQAAVRRGMERMASKIAQGAVTSAINLGAFNALGEAGNQFRYGGEITGVDPNTGRYVIGGYNPGAIGKSALEGAGTGLIIGPTGQLIGNVGNKLVGRATKTAEKAAIRGAQTLTSIVTEGTIFTAPEMLKGDLTFDDWLSSVELMAAFKLHGTVKPNRVRQADGTYKTVMPAVERIKELAGKRGNSRRDFMSRLNNMLDNRPDLTLTNDERAELQRGGYGDLADLVEGYKNTTPDQRKAMELKQPVFLEANKDGEVPYNRFIELVQDKNISEAARAKMYYYVTGNGLPQSTILGSTYKEHKDQNGNVTGYEVQSFGKDNGVITSRIFKNKAEAEAELNRINRQAELNGISMGEQAYDSDGDRQRMWDACKVIADQHGVTQSAVINMMDRVMKEPDKATDIEREWVNQVMDAASKLDRSLYPSANELQKSVGREYGVDVNAAIGKDEYRRSEQEQKAVKDYLEKLFADAMRDNTYINKQIEGPYKAGYDADEQQRSDIAIEAADGKEGAEEAWNGVQQRIEDDADIMAAEQREEAKVRTNKNDGAMHPATLKELDADGNPKEVFVVDGDFSMDAEGNISGSDVIVVYDPVEGKNREISPMEISSLGEVTTAEQQEQNIEANKQAYIQQQMDAATGRFNPQPGQLIDMPDGGQAVVLAVDEDNVTLQMPDGTQQIMAISDIQQITDVVAMEDYRQRHPEANAAPEVAAAEQTSNKIEGVPDEFVPGMTLTVIDGFGNEHSVTTDGKRYIMQFNPENGDINYIEDEDGRYIKMTEEDGEVLTYDLAGKGYGSVEKIKDYEMPQEPVAEVETLNEEQEVDKNGHPFITSSDGTTTFGEIKEESGLTPAPIKLSEGFNKVDERGNNIGYGRAHIEAGHGEQILSAGFSSIEEFVEYVARNYSEIRISKDRKDNKTYMLLEIQDEKHDATLYVELSNDGSYWNVNSGGIFKKKYTEKKEKVWPSPTVGSDANTNTAEVTGSPDESATGETADRGGNSPQTSKHKDTKNIPTGQIKNATNTETERPSVETPQQLTPESYAPEEYVTQPAVAPMPMRTVTIGKGKDKQDVEEPDFMATTAQRGHQYIYNEKGYPREVADEMVQTRHGNAAKTLDELTKSEPKMSDSNIGGSMALYDKIHGEWQAKKQAAEQEVKYWEDVMAEQQKAIAAEQAALKAQRQEQKEAEQGVPDMSVDKAADARRRGYRVSMGNRFDRQEPVQGMTGNETEIKFSDNDKVKGIFKVVESQQVQPSHMRGQRNPLHFITEAQPKDRTDEVSDDKSSKMAKNINPKEITEGVTAYVGAPVINSRGEVIQGNNRAIALKKLSGYPESAAKYKQYLIDHAAEFGLNADEIAKMENPVLVREVDVTDDEAIRLGQFTANDTESGGKQRMSASNILGQLDEQKSKSLFNLLLETGESEEDMTLDQIIDRNGTKVMTWLNRNGVINATQTQSAYDSKGHMTPEAKNDLKELITYHIFKGGSDAIGEAWGKLPVAAQKALAVAMAGDLQLKPEDRLLPDVQNAIMVAGRIENTMPEEVKSARRASEAKKRLEEMEKVVKAATQQMDLTTNKPIISGYSDLEMKIAAEILSLNQSQIKAIFEEYQRYVLGTGGSLFGEATKMSRQEAVEKIFNVKDTRNGSETETGIAESGDGARAEQLGRGERPSQGAAAAGEPGTAAAAEQPAGEVAESIARQEVNENPTEAQKEVGNYKKAHVKVDGFDVTIENKKGSTRSGVDPNGNAWSQTMHNNYGYILRTEGVDGDHIDVFLSDDPSQGDVFVVDQVNEDGSFDEHKVMYGFDSVEEAREAYLSNYEDGWHGLGAITPVSKEEFKKWIESSHRKTKPFSEYKSVETLGDVYMEQPKQQKAVADVEAGGAVVDKLQDMGVEVSTDIAENRRVRKQAEQDNSEAGKIHDLKNSDGNVYAFAYRGKLYLDPRRIDAELPLHEYGHLWTEAFRILNPEGWKGVVETIKQDVDGWNFIKELYPDLTTESEIADEVIATFSGKNGAEKLKAELERTAAKNPEYKSRWGNIYNNIVKAIQDFWKKVGDFLGIKYETPEQVYDQVLRDFAAGMNPRARVEKYLKEQDDAYMKAAESGDVEKATEIFNKALGEEVGNGMTPFVSVGNYFDVRNLAQKVKTRDPQVIQQVAEMMAPLIPDNAVLVPAPSHGGTATDMLDLANAIARIKGCEVADVLKSTPRASQYQTKRESGRPITADKMGITQIGVLPEGKVPVVVDNVVDSGNTAEACVKALGKALVVSLGNSADMYGHAATLKSAAPILKGRDGKIVPLSKRFDLGGSQYLGRAMQQKTGEEQTKTPAFKNFFGDWEKAARIEKLRKSPIVTVEKEDYNGKYNLDANSAQRWLKQNLKGDYPIDDTGEMVQLVNIGAEKVTSHNRFDDVHLKSISAIPKMLKNAIFIDEMPNTKNNDKFDKYRYYVVGVNIDGVDYTAKIVIGVKNGKKYYDHSLTQLEKTKLIDMLSQPVQGFKTTGNASLPSYTVGKDTKLFDILRNNSSKVVDDEGKPLVVYHGAYDGGFSIFDKSKRGTATNAKSAKKGFFFTDSKKWGEEWARRSANGELYEVYLNMRNPLVVDFEGKSVNADAELNKLINQAKREGYDGVIAKNLKDGFEVHNQYIVFEPNQIKSATNNNGDFNPNNDDIYFRSLDPESDDVVDNAEVGTRPLSDREKVAKLEAGPKVKVYRSMQLIDGKLYPPMSAKVDGKLREPSELGVWEEADEDPDMADENGKFKLDKGNRKSLKAAYNPYIHTSRTMLNDQFSEAQDRPNLVVVEMEVPESELTSGYKAEKAKDSVGAKQWKAGVIQGQRLQTLSAPT